MHVFPYMQGCEAAVVKYLTTNVISIGGVGFFYALIEVYDSTAAMHKLMLCIIL